MGPASKLTRRRFLGGAVAAPYVLASDVLGAGRAPPSERIEMGFIGVGGQGGHHVGRIVRRGDCQIVAVCDVDRGHRERARKTVEDHYGHARRSGAYRGCEAMNDFESLLARDDVDAVLVATPDHWHALASIAAVRAGKDVYCEKPMAATIAEGRAMVRAVGRHNRVFQTGSQERSGRARFACEVVRSGRLGRIHTIRTNLPTDNRRTGPQPPMPVPRGFDYDRWLGPAPWAPYTRERCHFNFRWIRDYSDGELTDRGAHVNDIALWGAWPWLKGPVEIEGTGEFPDEGLWNTAVAYRIEYRYAGGVRIVTTSEPPRGIRFEGTDGWVFVHIHGARLEAEPRSVLADPIGPDEVHLHEGPGHHEDFFRAVRTRGATVAPVEAGHRTATFCHLGTIALLLGRKLTWDPDAERFVGDDEANRMVSRPPREPWRV